MSRWIRWKGLIPFIIVSATVFLLWQFLVDGYIERLIEKSGTAAVGAKVDLDSADLSLFPLGATLKGLQVTNPDDPMKNVIQIDRISLTLDGSGLLFRKVIINEMAGEGIRFDTARKTSGALPEKKDRDAQKKKASRLSFPSLKLPDIKEILAREDLETLRLVQEMRADIEQEQSRWKTELEKLPDKKKIEEYESRIKKVKAATKGKPLDILGSASEVTELKKDIEKDMKEIKEARTGIENSLKTYKERLNTLKTAPKRDFQRLKDKYSISPRGLSNATQLIMGETAGLWVERILVWHERLKPLLESSKSDKKTPRQRGRGVDVIFDEYEPKPDVLVRLAKLDVTVKESTFSGTIENITNQQYITKHPVSFKFSGDSLKDIRSIKFGGTFDHIIPNASKDIFNLSIEGYQLKELKLSENRELPVTMKSGMANLEVRGLLGTNVIQSHANATFSAVNLNVDAQDEIGQIIGSVLQDIRAFNLKAFIVGSPDDYNVTITSDLDNALKTALSNQFAKFANKWEESLNSAVLEKTGGPLEGLNERIETLSSLKSELETRNTKITSLLNELTATKLPGIKLPF